MDTGNIISPRLVRQLEIEALMEREETMFNDEELDPE